MSRISTLALCAALALATAACGETPGERALTGGAIGAGGGAPGGAAAGNPWAGALRGGPGGWRGRRGGDAATLLLLSQPIRSGGRPTGRPCYANCSVIRRAPILSAMSPRAVASTRPASL